MSNQTTEAQPTKIVTGKVRLSYAHLWEPTAIEEGQDKKYSTAIIIDKSDKATVAQINKGIEFLKEQAKLKNNGKLPPKFKTPLRDGDEERPDDEVYANSYFLNASSKSKPGIVDKNVKPILDQDEVYSGCYARVSFNLYLFDTKGNKGIACGLNNVQKLADGDPLGGKSRAEDDFASVQDDDDVL